MAIKQIKSAVVVWVVTACALYAGCRADHGEYRTPGGLVNVTTNSNPVTNDDANASLQNNEIFRFLINLINLRVRLPADYLQLSRVQVVRVLSNNKEKTDAYNFKDGVPITLTYKKPSGLADGALLTLVFMDQKQQIFTYLKPGDQLKIVDNGDTLDFHFTAEKSIFIVVMVQLIGAPNPANVWVPNVDARPSVFSDFIAKQLDLFNEILAFSGPLVSPGNDTSVGTTTDTTTTTTSSTSTTTSSSTSTTTTSSTTNTTSATSTTTTSSTTTTTTGTTTTTDTSLVKNTQVLTQ